MPRPKTRDDELKNRLLDQSLALLESEGPTALTARRVASVAGTSTAAVYELFGNKSGLIRDIFYQGFEQLAAELDALASGDDAQADLHRSLDAARDFAVGRPMLFDVMYARPFAEFDPTTANIESAKRIYSHVVHRVAAFLEASSRSAATVDAAQALVAVNRGLIASELAGQLGGSAASISRRRTNTITAMLIGIRTMHSDSAKFDA